MSQSEGVARILALVEGLDDEHLEELLEALEPYSERLEEQDEDDERAARDRQAESSVPFPLSDDE